TIPVLDRRKPMPTTVIDPEPVVQESSATSEAKRPFDIDLAMARIEEAVGPFAKAALFELAEEGYNSVFEQLAACIISIRTRDEMTLPIARRLFEAARTPAAVLALTPEELERRIHGCAFYDAKARQIREIARR